MVRAEWVRVQRTFTTVYSYSSCLVQLASNAIHE